jgi:hypothetical protein
MTGEGIDYQLVPPGIHHRNTAKRVICTFKNFPLHLWDHLGPQVELILNMLRGSRINTKVSALTQLNGYFVFNQTPLISLGIQVLVHTKSANSTTWSPHAEDEWYIGHATD